MERVFNRVHRGAFTFGGLSLVGQTCFQLIAGKDKICNFLVPARLLPHFISM